MRVTVALQFLIASSPLLYVAVVKGAPANPFINQTSTGYFRTVQGAVDYRVPSIWMQNDAEKKLRLDIGVRGQPGFMTEYYFIGPDSYYLTQKTDGTYTCKKVAGFGYNDEQSTYGPVNFGYVGQHVLVDRNNWVVDVYAGQAMDAVGPLNVILSIGPQGEYLSMLITGAIGGPHYLEYWYGDDVSMTLPPDSYFVLPTECTNPETIVHYDPTSMKTRASVRSRFNADSLSSDKIAMH